MKATHFLPLIIALAFSGTCVKKGSNEIVKKGSKEIGYVIFKKEAAAQAAERAKYVADEIQIARSVKNSQRLAMLKKEENELGDQLIKALKDVTETKPLIRDASELQSVAKVEKELEGYVLGIDLGREIEDDVARIEKEYTDDIARMETQKGQSLREQCVDAIRGIPKAEVCFYLKTYVRELRAPTEEEWETHTQKTAVKCLFKQPSGFSQRNSMRSLMDAIEKAPDNSIKLQVAAAHLACS
jgi:hypothetical protein